MFILFEREIEQEKSSIFWFILQMPKTTRALPNHVQEPRIQSRCPMWMERAQVLVQAFTVSWGMHWQEAALEVEKPGLTSDNLPNIHSNNNL